MWHARTDPASIAESETVRSDFMQTESSSSRDVPTASKMPRVASQRCLEELKQSVLDDTFFLKPLDTLLEELVQLSPTERAIVDASVRARTDRGGCKNSGTDEPSGPTSSFADVQWALGLLLVPTLRNLPRDSAGLAVIPHSHPMVPQVACENSYAYLHRFAVYGYKTDKVCDNCQRDIYERSWFHCSLDCDIDFCTVCDTSLWQAIEHCRTVSGCNDSLETVATKCWNYVRVVDDAVSCLMHSSRNVRREMSSILRNVHPTTFTALVVCIRDYLNAKVVHVQDVKDIAADLSFWYLVSLMQMLHQINATRRITPAETFTLLGINKCEPLSELSRWKKNEHQRIKLVEDVEDMKFEIQSPDFCCFLTHSNLLPAAFLRTVVFYDAWGVLLQKQENQGGELRQTEIEVSRRPEETVLKQCTYVFGADNIDNIRCPLVIRFEGEVSEGPGVNREYLQIALTTLVQTDVFEYVESSHCYFFRRRDSAMSPNTRIICLAFGRLLAHIILNKVWLQVQPNETTSQISVEKVFPMVFFAIICHGLKNAVPRYKMDYLREFDPQAASSLDAILKHDGDVTEFCIDGLRNDNRAEYVRNYLIRRFHTDVSEPSTAMMEGFKSILGGSEVLQTLNPHQLKRILCGAEEDYVDITTLKQSARYEGFENEETYLDEFWALLDRWDEPMKRKFVRFVTAGDRAPLKGWCDLQLNIHKNGAEPTTRLPTAYTCYNMLLLPRYRDQAKLEGRLLAAINWAEGFGLQ